MNKNGLIDSLINKHELTKIFTRDLVDSVFGSRAGAATKGEEVAVGFKVGRLG
jgi:nucleoid DNA-binding protein